MGCGGLENVVSCVCNDEESTEVTDPRLCWTQEQARVVSCTCSDDSEWEAPEPPWGGKENITGCEQNEETGEAEISCADGTFEPAPGGRCRRPGGRGRGRGRGGNGGGNGDGDDEGDDYDGEGENEGRGGRGGRGSRGGGRG